MGFVTKKVSSKEEDRICALFLSRFKIGNEVIHGYYDEETSEVYEADAKTGSLTGRVVPNVRGPARPFSAYIPAQPSARFSLPLFQSGLDAIKKALREGNAEAEGDMEAYAGAVRACADVFLDVVSAKVHKTTDEITDGSEHTDTLPKSCGNCPHNRARSAISELNALLEKYGKEKIFAGDIKDEKQVFGFCASVCEKLFRF